MVNFELLQKAISKRRTQSGVSLAQLSSKKPMTRSYFLFYEPLIKL